MNAPQFHAHIEKRPVGRGHRWFCVTRELGMHGIICIHHRQYKEYGPFRLKREAKLVKDSAKKSYAETRRVFK